MAEKRGTALGWWVISGESIMDMLWRAFAGEDPDLIYAEHYANSEVERAEDS
jgi:hypothetical protein